MKKIIYIRLLNEGTNVYRPVSAFEIDENVYKILETEIYDPNDEEWEFLPNTQVIVEKQNLGGEIVLVAIKESR